MNSGKKFISSYRKIFFLATSLHPFILGIRKIDQITENNCYHIYFLSLIFSHIYLFCHYFSPYASCEIKILYLAHKIFFFCKFLTANRPWFRRFYCRTRLGLILFPLSTLCLLPTLHPGPTLCVGPMFHPGPTLSPEPMLHLEPTLVQDLHYIQYLCYIQNLHPDINFIFFNNLQHHNLVIILVCSIRKNYRSVFLCFVHRHSI